MATSTMDLIQQHLGDDGLAQLTQHLGVDPATAKAAAEAALPQIINAMTNQASQPGAAAGIGGLAGLAGGLLGNLFGGNHADVSEHVSNKSGIDLHTAEKALMFLAPIILAKLQQQHAGATASVPSTPQTQGQGTQPAQPQADGDSALGRVIGEVEKIFKG
jgi:hypothetical protein